MFQIEPGWFVAQGQGTFFKLTRVVAVSAEGQPVIAVDGHFEPAVEPCVLTFREGNKLQYFYESREQFLETHTYQNVWLTEQFNNTEDGEELIQIGEESMTVDEWMVRYGPQIT